jgi:hypothetical protein
MPSQQTIKKRLLRLNQKECLEYNIKIHDLDTQLEGCKDLLRIIKNYIDTIQNIKIRLKTLHRR